MKAQHVTAMALAGLCFSGSAHAQTATASPSSPAADPLPAAQADPANAHPTPDVSQDAGLQDIVVTAQRRSESLQRAAIAVTAVGGADLARAGVADSSLLTRVAPALQISAVGGPTNTFYLRGVGNFSVNVLSDPAVSVNIDGVVIARPTSVQGLFFDLDRVEVLKGPQGTLYGRNATGGAINLISNKPVLGELSGYANFEYGNYDAKKINGALNIPLGERGALRIAGQVVDRDGTYTDGSGDDKQQALRLQLASQLTDELRVTVGADYAHQGGLGSGATVRGLNPDDRIGLADARAGALYSNTLSFLAGDTLRPLGRDIYNRNDYWGMYLQADVETPLGDLTILPAYRRADVNFRTTSGSFYWTERSKSDQTSVEMRLASPAGKRLGYILGLYSFFERNKATDSYAQQYYANYANFPPKTNSYAAFARLNFSLTDSFRITGGARYTIDDKSTNINNVNALVVCPGVFVPPPGGPSFCFGGPTIPSTLTAPSILFAPNGALIPVQPFGSGDILQGSGNSLSPSRTFKKLTYRAGVEYDVAPASLLYASYETGFKAGGFYSTIDDPTFQPETITAITLGSKNRFLNNRLQLNVEAYRWNYKNQQVSLFRANSLGGTEFVTQNVGRTRLQGVEAEARARVFGGTTLSGTVQYLDAKNLEFTYNSAAAVGAPVTGCAFTGPSNGNYVVDCGGRRPAQSPKWTFNLGLEQRVSLGKAGSLTANASTRYQSEVYTGTELLPSELQSAYWMSDLQLSWSSASGAFSVAGFVNNLENNNVVGYSQPQPRAPALIVQVLRQPRMYGIRTGLKF